MDKITKVQEVSSFIVNFDNKYWNEVILRLTIIGIRYVTNNYQNTFSWKLNDLNNILEQLNKKKDSKRYNAKTHYSNKRETKKVYNYNYNNSSLVRNKENDNSINGKKINFMNSLTQNEINNNRDMGLLSERNYFGKDRFYKKIRKSKGQNAYLKNKSNRNKILSLKQNSFDGNDKKINVVVSNFPFHQSSTINEKEYYKDKFEKTKDNLVFYLNQEKGDFSATTRMGSIERNNNKNVLERVYSSFGEYNPKYSSKEYSIKRNNKLSNDISLIKEKDDYKKDSKEFISELRRLSQNKDYKPKNPKKAFTNLISNQQPKLSVCYSSPLIDTKKLPLKSSYQNNSELNLRENIEKVNKIKSDISITNKGTEKEKKENSLTNTINNRKYNFKSTNDNLQINFQYGGINNNESVNNIENISSVLNTNNKYLEKTIQKTEKMKYNYKKDIMKSEKSNLNFEYTSNKENNNNNNMSNSNSNIDLNFKVPNSNRNTSNYIYEIQSSTNKKNNTELINKYKKGEEKEIKENNNIK